MASRRSLPRKMKRTDRADYGAYALTPRPSRAIRSAITRYWRKRLPRCLIESLIEYGFVPEFAGRFPIIVPLAPLTKEQMRLALTQPKNSVIKQQVELFRRDGIDLKFTEEALDADGRKSR